MAFCPGNMAIGVGKAPTILGFAVDNCKRVGGCLVLILSFVKRGQVTDEI